MKKKKWEYIFLIIGVLSIFQTSFSQTNTDEEEEVFIEYNKELAKDDFEKAIKFEKSDSLIEAIRCYKRVAKYDSTNRIGKLSKSKLDSVWLIEKEIFSNQILGNWRWIWSGTNWGTEDSPNKCICERIAKFEKDQIVFYENGVEQEKLGYEIIYDLKRIGTGQVLIKIKEGGDVWRLIIYEKIDNSLFLMERNKDSELFLNFRDIGILPRCVCGCPEKRFEKIKSD